MVNGVKGSGEVQEDEYGEKARVRGEKEIICDFDKCSFSAVKPAETGLKLFEQSVRVKMRCNSGCNDTFKDFRQEWKVGDGPEVAQDVRVETGLFEDGGDGS